MSFQDNLNLLTSILKSDDTATAKLVEKGDFEFELFERFIVKNQLRGYLYTKLAHSPVRESFPPGLISNLESSYRRQERNNEKLFRALRHLAGVFSEAQSEFILLKGPYLAERFYGGIARRAFWDIDLLVRKHQLAHSQELLLSEGYARTSRILLRESWSRYFTHAFDFAKEGIRLDLHWSLSNHVSYNFNYDEIWKRKQLFCFEEICFFVLSDEHEIVFNLIAAARDLERGGMRLRSFVDLYLMLKVMTEVDWDQFIANRKAEATSQVCLSMLSLFLNVLDCHEEFSGLVSLINREGNFLSVNNRALAEKLLAPSGFSLRNRLWTIRLYETSSLRVFLWWLISMPFRLLVYRPTRMGFRRNAGRTSRTLKQGRS